MSARLKVALLSYEYPPETGFGGIGAYTWHHARALAAIGHDVHVLAGATEPTSLRVVEQNGVRVHRYRADGLVMRAFARLGGLGLWWTRQRLENAWSMYRAVAQLQKQHRYDVLEMPECGAEGALVTRTLGAPSVVRLHSPSKLIMPYYDVRPADTRWCAAIERPALTAATAVTSCSQYLADEARLQMGVQRAIQVIPNGVDIEWLDDTAAPVDVYEKYGLPRGRPMILFAGRMERRKGIHLCTEIARTILERHDVSLVLAGRDLFGYVRQTLLPTLAARRLRGSIHWLGAVAMADLRLLTSGCDVYLLPSLWENCPYSCLEAMAASRAVVSADQGGMPELIQNGVNGLLAAAGDAGAFVQQIERLLDDHRLRSSLGSAARRTIERRHDATDIARRSVSLYEDAIAGRAATA